MMRPVVGSPRDRGFTLIELLVVMVIVGVLAAIAIPLFLSQREKAADTAVKTDLSAVGKAVMAYYVDGDDALVLSGGAGSPWRLAEQAGSATVFIGPSSPNVTFVSAATTISGLDTWCISMRHPDGKIKDLHYDALTGLGEGTC